MKKISKLHKDSITTGDAREDLFEIREKINEIITKINKIIAQLIPTEIIERKYKR